MPARIKHLSTIEVRIHFDFDAKIDAIAYIE